MQNYIGQRLSFEGDRCTVRYLGIVEGKDGSWLGIEWDDDQKGKHDGVVNGHRYFECQSSSLTAGSFIRPSRKSDQCVSFLQALKQKYALAEAANDAIRISGKTVEEVGFGKIQTQLQKFQQLEIIILDSRCIFVNQQMKASQVNEIRSLQLQIQDLDLSRNLFETWDDVLSICAALNHLRSLSVGGNRFSDTTTFLTNKPAWPTTWQIETLSLASTLISWEKIVTLTANFPRLRSLDASSNRISRMLQPLQQTDIRTLDLASNSVVSLKDLAPLSELPHLEDLSLRFNPLDDLASGSAIQFHSLQRLDLTGTKLPGLKSLDAIPKVFPALKYLQTKDTPLAKVDSATLHTVARLAKLLELNHSPISAEERQNAELFYLGKIVIELEGAKDEAEEANILLNHPIWDALCDIYGTPTIKRNASQIINPNTLEARVSNFTFYISPSSLANLQTEHASKPEQPTKDMTTTTKSSVPSPSPSTSSNPIPEKSTPIPNTTSLYALYGIAGRLLNLPPPFTTTIRLFHETDEYDPVAPTDGEDDEEGWSVSEDEDEGEDGRGGQRKEEKGERLRRMEEMVPSTRPVGDFVGDFVGSAGEGGKRGVRVMVVLLRR